MRLFGVGLIAALVPLAGCLGDAGSNELDAHGTSVLPWGVDDCQIAVAIVPAMQDAVAEHLPEGFRSLSMEEVAGTGTAVAGEANLGIEMMVCQSGATLDGIAEDLVYGSFFTAVEAPEDLRENVTMSFVKWETLIPDEARRTTLQSLGIPAVNGSAKFDLHQGSGTNWVYDGTMDFDGSTFHFTGASNQPAGEDFQFVEYMETDAGLVRWFATVDADNVGLGPVTVQVGGGRAADILGAPVAMGAAFGGQMSFTDATIVVPA